MAHAVRYVDRESGSVREEPVYGRTALELAYRTGVGRALVGLLPHRFLSACYGWLQRLPSSRGKIPKFIDRLAIDATEAEHTVDLYHSLDHFFCRRLKPNARTIDVTPSRFVMPADGRTLVFPKLGSATFAIKGNHVQLAELLQDARRAEYYRDGTAIVVRLAPCDYHRFHFPDSGQASDTRRIRGRLHSVHPIALLSRAPCFRNLRHVTQLESDNFGRVTLVEIGAFAVGSIIQTYLPGPVGRGQEKGYFHFGGSTVVALVPANRLILDEDLVSASDAGVETFVKMGTSIGSSSLVPQTGRRIAELPHRDSAEVTDRTPKQS